MSAWLCAIIVWPPSTSCGPRSSVPPVTRRTDVQPSFSFCDSSVWVSSSMSTMFAVLTWANAGRGASAETASDGKRDFLHDILQKKGQYPFPLSGEGDVAQHDTHL